MTPIFCCGFECGVTGNVGQHFAALTNASISTTGQRSGARCLRVNPTAAIPIANTNAIFSNSLLVVRFYIYFTTLPNNGVRICDTNNSSGILFDPADNKIKTIGGSGTPGTNGVTVTTGVWYRIDARFDESNNPRLVDGYVDGVALGQRSDSFAAATITTLKFGNSSSFTGDYYIDDILVSATTGDFPLGAGYVNHFIPVSDGTHSVAGANDFERTLTGTDITNATTDAYTLINAVPLQSGAVTSGVTFVNMVAPPGAFDAVRVNLGPASGISTPTTAPRAVEAIAVIGQAGTGTGNMAVYLGNADTNQFIYSALGVAGTTTLAYKRAHFATWNAAPWTVSGFNTLWSQLSSGGTVDANPDQYWAGTMLEAEFAEVISRTPRPTSIGHPFII